MRRALLLLALASGLSLLPAPPGAGAPAPFVRRHPKEITSSVGMRLAWVPPGKFLMGARADEHQARADEKPRHEVEITRGFYLGVCEVTQEEYQKVTGSNPSYYAPTGGGRHLVGGLDTRRFPVENVSWNDCIAFCARLSALAAEKKAGRVYRLPTEAEWEYACRGGVKDSKAYSWGDEPDTKQGNFGGVLRHTCAVGSYKPNGFGLFDMHGNVYEWCHDWHGRDYYKNSPRRDPPGPANGTSRVYRGATYSSPVSYARSAYRTSATPHSRFYGVGMRVACDAGRGR